MEVSQLLNKEHCVVKAVALLKSALHVDKKRKATKIPKSVKRRRLANKQNLSDKKEEEKSHNGIIET